jgi:hypothetical protein
MKVGMVSDGDWLVTYLREHFAHFDEVAVGLKQERDVNFAEHD